jgi:uncharacterized membrane protein
VWWDVTGPSKDSPHPISLLRHWATIQQAHTELPEDGASEAPKHIGLNKCANTLVFYAFVGFLFAMFQIAKKKGLFMLFLLSYILFSSSEILPPPH